jgi:HJR/Mrr/RecB family endonuclease
MSERFAGVISAECEYCSTQNDIDVSELDINCIGGDHHDNGMGDEFLYCFDGYFDCTKCRREFFVNFEVAEYPLGVVNNVQDYSKGAKCSGEPYIEDDEDDSLIYTFPEPEIYIPSKTIITDVSDLRNTIPDLIRLIQEDESYLHHISPREFEEIIAEIFRNQGFEVELTKRTRDGGKDVIAVRRDFLGITMKYFIECKRYSETNKVDVSIVRSLYGVHSGINGPNKSIIATTSTFTQDAIKFASTMLRSEWDMELIDRNAVLQWIRAYKS